MTFLIFLFFSLEKHTSHKQYQFPLLRHHVIPKKYSALFYLARLCQRLNQCTDINTFEWIFQIDIHLFESLEWRFIPLYNQARLWLSSGNHPWLSNGWPKWQCFTGKEILLTVLKLLVIRTHHDDLTMLYGSVPSVLSISVSNGLHCLLITLQN